MVFIHDHSLVFSLALISCMLFVSAEALDGEDEDSSSVDHSDDSEACVSFGCWATSLGLLLFMLLLCCVSAFGVHRKEKQQKKQRELELREKLDSQLPATLYGKGEDLERQTSEAEVCCICLDEMEGTFVRKLHCGHVMHQNCFDRWCWHLTHPECRKDLKEKREESLWTCPLCKHPAVNEGWGNPPVVKTEVHGTPVVVQAVVVQAVVEHGVWPA